MKHTLLFIGLILNSFVGLSQNTGSIKGAISDGTKKNIELANITLYRAADSVFVKAAITDEKGVFEMDNIPFETYYLKAQLSGFEGFRSAHFTINSENTTADFPKIVLKATTTVLNEVTIVKEKPFVEKKLDKLVVNVENSIVAAGNSVLEVLERSPGVVVNQETSINLKGKSGVIVMVDGKPTPLSGTDLITYLKGIPASNIQSIEIIANPSAKYDAAGNAGIINIKFKKDQKQGLNGSASLSYGQGVYAKPSASGNFNYRNKKWNFFGSHSYSNPINYARFYINRRFFDENHVFISNFEQNTFTKMPLTSNNTRLGADYYATEKTVFGVMVNSNWNSNNRNGNTHALITNPDGSLDYTTDTQILSDEKRFNGFANFNFKHSFNTAGRDLTADLDFGQFDAKTNQHIQNYNAHADGSTTESKILTNQIGNIAVKSLKADYVHPFSTSAKLEIGLKTSLVKSDNDVRFYDVENGQNELDPDRSNHFIYEENINAAYGSYAKELKKWDFQCGLRMEQTITKGEQLATNETFSKNYINFFPNAVINRKFNDENSLSLSYTKRIDRPTYRQLNPFRIFVDSYTYVVGDPTLKPVITNLFELAYTFKGQYIFTLSYNKSKESITDIFVQDDVTRISYQIPANIQDYQQYNLEVFVPIKYKKLLSSTLSGSVFLNQYESLLQGGTLVNDFTSWYANFNNNFTLGKGWAAELNIFYQSKLGWGLFYINNLAQITSGIQKTSKDKKSTFKFSVSDIFLTNHIAVEVAYQNQDFKTNRTWDSRVATLSYSYRFGKSTVAKARQRNSGVEDEKRRAG